MAEYTTLIPTTCSVGSTGMMSLTVLLSAALMADSAVTNVCTPAPSDSVFVHDEPSAGRRTLYGQNVTELQSRISITVFAKPASKSSDDGEVAPVSCLDLATSSSDLEPRPTAGIPPPARPRARRSGVISTSPAAAAAAVNGPHATFPQVTYLCQTNDLQRPFTLACPTIENLFDRLNVFTDILWLLYAHVVYSVHARCFEYLSIA